MKDECERPAHFRVSGGMKENGVALWLFWSDGDHPERDYTYVAKTPDVQRLNYGERADQPTLRLTPNDLRQVIEDLITVYQREVDYEWVPSAFEDLAEDAEVTLDQDELATMFQLSQDNARLTGQLQVMEQLIQAFVAPLAPNYEPPKTGSFEPDDDLPF